MDPVYPVYVPSRGRHQPERALTVRRLLREDVPLNLVVEEHEADAYRTLIPAGAPATVLVLPDRDRGLIYARNWIRDHAEAAGYGRHWQLDDNIRDFRRLWHGRRIPCDAGTALRVVEILSDRYTNVAISGLAYQMMVPSYMGPYFQNVHVYSCTLVNHAMPYRWRLAYNDDTDICLQALANGWTTLLINAFMANKLWTMQSRGGNTDDLYGVGAADDDAAGHTDTFGRYEMARSLEVAWPGIVKASRRFNRYQHSVNWGAFTTPLEPTAYENARRHGTYGAPGEVDELDLSLEAVREPDSPAIRRLLDEYPDAVATARAHDNVWTGLPAFLPYRRPPGLLVTFPTDEERDATISRLGMTIAKKTGPTHSGWWPPRPREDLASLRFVAGSRTPHRCDGSGTPGLAHTTTGRP